MRLAYVTAERGSCRRKQVGALVVRDRDKRIISGGYNGAPRGMPDCLAVGCDVRVIDGRESCVRTLHAESNALDLCGPLSEPHTLYTTVVPCRLCALRIIQAGIKTVFYHEWYQSQGTLEVEALFAARDPSSIEQDSRMPNENYRRPGRVDLQRIELPMELVRPTWMEQPV
jgi:dCMP deaminase